MRTTSRRRTAIHLVAALVASTVGLLAPTPAGAQEAPGTPTFEGRACSPGEGVTVVVDPHTESDVVRIGCAPGQQANGFEALTNAGFTINEDGGPVGGTICQIGHVPSEGYPHCWYDGFWGYWKSNGSTEWTWSQVGAGSGPLPVGSVEGWSWTEPVPEDYSGLLPRITVAGLADHAVAVDCDAVPQLPVLSILHRDEVLPVALDDGRPVEVAVLDPADDPATATYAVASTLSLADRTGETRVLARRAGSDCPNPPTFDATYDVRDAYAPRWNLTGAGAPSPAVDRTSADIVGWATGVADYQAGANVAPSWQTPDNAIGGGGGLVVLGDRGSITLTFDPPITDGPGYDLASFENGFAVNPAANGIDFLEIAYVEVSSNGTDFVRFDTGSRQPTPVGGFQGQRADLLGGVAGKDLAGKGTPFDLSTLANKPEVRSGAVDLEQISHVRLVDITGDGLDLDSFGRPIYDAHPTTGSAGYDLTGVAALNAYEAPPCAVDGAGGEAAALTWLGCELDRNGGTLPSSFGGTDWGLTLDAVLAFALDGQADAPAAASALDAVYTNIRSYVTDRDFGAGNDRYAGALAKSLLAGELAGVDTSAVDGLDLEAELRARMQTGGADAGRFSDSSAWGDYSNGIGQALAVAALSHTDDGIPAEAVDFLVDQQCPDGGFRGDYSTSGGCTDDAQADLDYTAFALNALSSAPATPAVQDAVGDAADWLVDHQAGTGALPATGSNANSSGLAAQALRAVGRTAQADAAAGWVGTVQLTADSAATADLSGHLGAIAFDTATHDAALTGGLDPAGLDVWRRATAQGLLAFDAPRYGAEPAAAPCPLDGTGGEDAALTWLDCELQGNGGVLPSPYGGDDLGLTLDVVLAFGVNGRADEAGPTAALDAVYANIRDYVTGADFAPDDRYAGALGKSLLAGEIAGVDTSDVDGLDLEAEVRARMQTSGTDRGRFSDRSDWGDYSNGFGQSLSMLALSHTNGGVPAPAVDFLLDQQCPDGGFRGVYTTTGGCTSAGSSDTDYTALAVAALASAPQSAQVRAAVTDGADWLIDHQDASGAITGSGLVAGTNTNSTGLAAQALRAVGRTAQADAAATWVRSVQLADDSGATADLSGRLGAIAYNEAAYDDALVAGVDPLNLDQWRRATAQALLAFDAPSFGVPGAVVRTPQESWTLAVHRDFLDRDATPAEVTTTVGRLAAGVTKKKIATELSASDEWLATIITRFYRDTLDRDPDPAGLAHWTGEIRSGRRTVASVAAQFYASGEYYGRVGGTNAAWVTALYDALLHRSPDAAGLAYWTGRTASKGRPAVAAAMYGSLESRKDRVEALYQALLGRSADAAGRTYWAGRIATEGDLALAVHLVTSAEYQTRANSRFP